VISEAAACGQTSRPILRAHVTGRTQRIAAWARATSRCSEVQGTLHGGELQPRQRVGDDPSSASNPGRFTVTAPIRTLA